jgi:hypothetical protein
MFPYVVIFMILNIVKIVIFDVILRDVNKKYGIVGKN